MTNNPEQDTDSARARARELSQLREGERSLTVGRRIGIIRSMMAQQVWTEKNGATWATAFAAEWKLSESRIRDHSTEARHQIEMLVSADDMKPFFSDLVAQAATEALSAGKYESVAKLVDSGARLIGLVQSGAVVNVLFNERTKELSPEAAELVREASRLTREHEGARWRELATLAPPEHQEAMAWLLRTNDERCEVMPARLAKGAE